MNIDDQVYPFVDEYGYTWMDPSGMITPDKEEGPCFICGRYTNRIDIDYQGYFCDSYACVLTIDFDLRGIKPYDPQ